MLCNITNEEVSKNKSITHQARLKKIGTTIIGKLIVAILRTITKKFESLVWQK